MTILVFAHDGYYPSGGAKDLVGRVNALDDVLPLLATVNRREYAHAYDVDAAKIVGNWTRASVDGQIYRTGAWEIKQ